MLRRTATVLLLSALTLLPISSCRKFEAPVDLSRVQGYQRLVNVTSIPANWGNLVSVTNSPKWPDLADLWFQDGDGNLRMVVYKLTTRELVDVTLIPRK